MTTSRDELAIVIGGGIAGLTAARTLQEQDRDFILLERCPTLGGLTRTVEVGEFCFDYTGHFLHLCRYPTPADIPYAGLNNNDWTQVHRRSCCYVEGKLITAPIQYNLCELPPSTLAECMESYENRTKNAQQSSETFHDYIVNGFGERLANLFLIPQNEKTMAVQLDRLSSSAAKRFFPAPNESLVRNGAQQNAKNGGHGYNAQFWYPKSGGIGHLVNGIRSGLENCGVNQEVVAVDLDARKVVTSAGETHRWSTLFSSMPLKELCRITDDNDLNEWAAQLTHSCTVTFNLGIRRELPPEFQDIHWIYVPNRNISFYRVGFYSNISKGICTPGHSAMYVEVGMTPEELCQLRSMEDLQADVLSGLEMLGWVNRKDIVCIVTHIIRYAYVHHTHKRDSVVRAILDRLAEKDVIPIGRYGLWDYTSMEDSMESARAAVLENASCNTRS
jgi:protoporphyrinogen oxidase